MTIKYPNLFQAALVVAKYEEAIRIWWNDGDEYYLGLLVPSEYKDYVTSVKAVEEIDHNGIHWVVRVVLSSGTTYDLCEAGFEALKPLKAYVDSVHYAADVQAYLLVDFDKASTSEMHSHMYEEVLRISAGFNHDLWGTLTAND